MLINNCVRHTILFYLMFGLDGVFSITSSYYKRILISKDSFTGNTLSETPNLRQVIISNSLQLRAHHINFWLILTLLSIYELDHILARGLNVEGYAPQNQNVVHFTLMEKHVVYLKLLISF